MPSSKLYEFLKALSESEEKLSAFERDADEAMTAAGLSEDEKDLVRSGDEQRIMRHLGSEEGTGTAARRFSYRIRNIRVVRFGV